MLVQRLRIVRRSKRVFACQLVVMKFVILHRKVKVKEEIGWREEENLLIDYQQ